MPLNQQQLEQFKTLLRFNETSGVSNITPTADAFATHPDTARPIAGQGSQAFAAFITQSMMSFEIRRKSFSILMLLRL